MTGNERLQAIRERESKATEEPLEVIRYEHGGGRMFTPKQENGTSDLIADFYDEANREFYAHSRADIPYLLERVAKLEGALRYVLMVRSLKCEHKHPGPDHSCAVCKAEAALAEGGV